MYYKPKFKALEVEIYIFCQFFKLNKNYHWTFGLKFDIFRSVGPINTLQVLSNRVMITRQVMISCCVENVKKKLKK